MQIKLDTNIPTLFPKAFLVREIPTALQTFQTDVRRIVVTLNNVQEYLNFHRSLLLRKPRITVVVNLKGITCLENEMIFFLNYLIVCGGVF